MPDFTLADVRAMADSLQARANHHQVGLKVTLPAPNARQPLVPLPS